MDIQLDGCMSFVKGSEDMQRYICLLPCRECILAGNILSSLLIVIIIYYVFSM